MFYLFNMKKKMKKFLNISLLAIVALSTLSLTSCLHEMDDVFDQDAVIRMEDAKAKYFDILTSNGGKWKLEYFSNTGEPGYTYVLTFAKDGMVTMSGHNKWINYIKNNSLNASAFGSDRSMWELLADNSLVLSFNTYNPYFHFFAAPDKVPTGGASGDGIASTEGYGHEGDYEFNIMKYSGDTIYLTGKKYDLPMFMTRLDASTDDASFLGEVSTWKKNLFNTSIPYVYIVLPDGNRWIVEDASVVSDGNLRMYREGEDRITSSEYHNVNITYDGMDFMRPLTLDGYTFQHFKRQADGTLLCKDDNKTKIIGYDLNNYLFLYDGVNTLSWRTDFDPSKNDLGGNYEDLIKQINDSLPKVPGEKPKSKLRDAVIKYNLDSLSFELIVYVKRDNAIEAHYYFEPSSDSQVKFNFTARNSYATRLYNNCGPIRDLINRLGSTTYSLSAVSMLGPSAITMSENGSPDNYIIWHLQ